ncbi:hypothetical protein RCL1_006776 [Eukaryota sp. TZLM3-RCL]
MSSDTPPDECVKVAVRVRPLSEKEHATNSSSVIATDTRSHMTTVLTGSQSASFSFDTVFSTSSSQSDVYSFIHPSVQSCLDGFNASIIAYGQTGTGKTYTMEGLSDPDHWGIIPRTFDHIFSHITTTSSSKIHYLVSASMVEIYNEDIYDLLNQEDARKGVKLDLREHPEIGPVINGLEQFTVKNSNELFELLNRGSTRRMTAETLMNRSSSRSHSIFTLRIESSEELHDDLQRIRVAKLNLVDLAGSERQSKSGATGIRLIEASKINRSLFTLGNVIKALVEGTPKHVPYRDSKLTRILQDSLGGSTKTVMIATISPCSNSLEETLSTLRYASTAKKIKNTPRINEDPKDSLIKQLQSQLNELTRKLQEQMLSHVRNSISLVPRTDLTCQNCKQNKEKQRKEKEGQENKINAFRQRLLSTSITSRDQVLSILDEFFSTPPQSTVHSNQTPLNQINFPDLLIMEDHVTNTSMSFSESINHLRATQSNLVSQLEIINSYSSILKSSFCFTPQINKSQKKSRNYEPPIKSFDLESVSENWITKLEDSDDVIQDFDLIDESVDDEKKIVEVDPFNQIYDSLMESKLTDISAVINRLTQSIKFDCSPASKVVELLFNEITTLSERLKSTESELEIRCVSEKSALLAVQQLTQQLKKARIGDVTNQSQSRHRGLTEFRQFFQQKSSD